MTQMGLKKSPARPLSQRRMGEQHERKRKGSAAAQERGRRGSIQGGGHRLKEGIRDVLAERINRAS